MGDADVVDGKGADVAVGGGAEVGEGDAVGDGGGDDDADGFIGDSDVDTDGFIGASDVDADGFGTIVIGNADDCEAIFSHVKARKAKKMKNFIFVCFSICAVIKGLVL